MRELPLCGRRAKAEALVALVDDADFGWLSVYRWYPQKRRTGQGYYVMRHVTSSDAKPHLTQYMHTLICDGVKPIDHIDRNTLNNQRSNLRPALKNQNNWNASKRVDGVTSQYRGVHFRYQNSKWVAQIGLNGTRKNLGSYLTEVEAALAYDKAARDNFGDFAALNFP